MAPPPKFVYDSVDDEVESRGMLKIIEDAMELARAPISGVNVGVIGVVSSGRIFLGVNVEFPCLPFHHSISAEQFLVTNLALNNEKQHMSFAIIATNESVTPYGHCFQFLQEISDAPEINILMIDKKNRDKRFVKLDKFLPYKFDERYDPRLLEDRNNRLAFSDPNNTGDICSKPNRCHHLKCRALEAANQSYAPYSDCPSGVALMDNDKKVYKGWYIESASYHLGMGPVQAALVDFMIHGQGKEFREITGAVLVEKEDAMVRQRTRPVRFSERYWWRRRMRWSAKRTRRGCF